MSRPIAKRNGKPAYVDAPPRRRASERAPFVPYLEREAMERQPRRWWRVFR